MGKIQSKRFTNYRLIKILNKVIFKFEEENIIYIIYITYLYFLKLCIAHFKKISIKLLLVKLFLIESFVFFNKILFLFLFPFFLNLEINI